GANLKLIRGRGSPNGSRWSSASVTRLFGSGSTSTEGPIASSREMWSLTALPSAAPRMPFIANACAARIGPTARCQPSLDGDDADLAARFAHAPVGAHEAERRNAAVETHDDLVRNRQRLDACTRGLGLRDMHARIVFGADRTDRNA